MSFRRFIVITASFLSVLPMAVPAQASTDVSGRWDSLSLRDNRIGYFLTMNPRYNVDSAYFGFIRFEYRDGRKGPRMPFTATVRDEEITFRAKEDRFDRGRGVLRGELSSDGSTLTLINCEDRLRLVMARALDSDCVFTPDD